MTPVVRRLLLSALVPLSLGAPAEAAGPPWSSLELEGRKLFLEARVRLEAEVVPSVTIRDRLVSDGDLDALGAARRTLRLTTSTRLLGRTTEIETLLRVHSLAALQRDLLEVGSRNRSKIYRFGNDSVLALRAEPAAAAEKELAPGAWTRRSRQLLSRPTNDVQDDQNPTDPVALLIAASTWPVDELRAGVERTVLSGNRFDRALLRLTEETTAKVDLVVDGQRITGDRPIRRFEISSLDGESLEMLGLSGTILLDVDQATGVPLQLRGRVPVFGSVAMKVRSATTSGD